MARRPKGDRGTTVPSKKKDKGGNLYHVTFVTVNRITRWRKWMTPETQKQQNVTNSRIKTSAVEGVLKILETYTKATEF